MTKLIESARESRQYGMDCAEAIVDIDGRRVYFVQGFGGTRELCGGAYRWRHGLAISVSSSDTLSSLHSDINAFLAMINGYDPDRPIIDWDGVMIDNIMSSLL